MTVEAHIRPLPVIKELTVTASPQHAFDVFTRSMGKWWPKSHSTNASPIAEIILEPHEGGRWGERGEDGSACDWGHVLVWQPPERLVLAWQLDADFKFDPRLSTEVEVTFVPEGDGTRVRLVHRQLERFGERAAEIAQAIGGEGGWPGILSSFKTVCEDLEQR